MISQVPISARIDSWTKWRADQFASENHTTRNRMINDGLRLLMDLETIRGNMRRYNTMKTRMKILKLFVKMWIPELDPDYQL